MCKRHIENGRPYGEVFIVDNGLALLEHVGDKNLANIWLVLL